MAAVARKNLHLVLSNELSGAFNLLLQQGVRVVCRPGCTLGELLSGQWGIDAEYVSRRITTLFLNCRAIDDVATAHVAGGAVIALSGAMPGLVGATMRRGGFYAAMRGAMTYREGVAGEENQVDWVRVKLFNLILPELGPGFLSHGIIMTAAELLAFITAREFPAGCFTAPPAIDGRLQSTGELEESLALAGEEEVHLTVEFKD
ncbi:MAG: hypothetical protein FIA91_05725 [Geobacter sp.]|nr:hypothetical protein [Geobacter sp.]